MAESVCRKKSGSYSRQTTRKSVYLWEFLFGLLEDDECAPVLSWTNKREGTFVLRNTEELAKLWGTVKNRPMMDKYKLFRAMRTYYDTGILKKIKGHKGVYQFLSIPYETEGCDLKVGKASRKKYKAQHHEHNGTVCKAIPANCNSEKLTDTHEIKSEYRKNSENNRESSVNHWEMSENNRESSENNRESSENHRERAVDNREETEHHSEESNRYRSRCESSWSESSLSSDSSATRSLDDMDMVFSDDIDEGLGQELKR